MNSKFQFIIDVSFILDNDFGQREKKNIFLAFMSNWNIQTGVNIFDISEGSSKGRVSNREVARLRQQNQVLLEENNLLKLKVELLLDMVNIQSKVV